MRHIYRLLIGLTVLFLIVPMSVQAQEEPVVYGIFFYSPTCPHCHEVINNHWDGIQAEFGEQLQVIFINVQVAEGSQLMQTARQAMNIEASGVPMLIIGERVFVGSYQIPNDAPVFIRQGLANGGIDVPPIPGIDDVFAQTFGTDFTAFSGEESGILSDPANIVAIAMLVGLVVSLLLVFGAGLNPSLQPLLRGNLALTALLLTIVTGIGLTVSLLSGSDNLYITIMTVIMGLALLVVMFWLINDWSLEKLPDRAIPLLLLTGIIVAGYLSYVEMTATEAVCGIVGNCNVVQQSEYAQILGIPIGVIGIIGYVSLFVIWLFGQKSKQSYILLFGLISAGVLFSTYLTFLEPFVIGASCVWCLTSAVTMLALLWLVAPLVFDEKAKNDMEVAL